MRFWLVKTSPVTAKPSYSPELSTCVFFLFQRLKNPLKVRHFRTLENIQTAVTEQLKAIQVFEFQHWYKVGKNRLQRC